METVSERGALMDEGVHPVARLSWRAILAGSIASLSITWLLLSLGGAVGLTAMERDRGMDAGAGASWVVFASGLVGAICGMAGGATGLRRFGPAHPTDRGMPIHRPVVGNPAS